MRWRFFARRLVLMLASLLAASFVIFAALYLARGSRSPRNQAPSRDLGP